MPCANLSKGYHELNVYSIICQIDTSASKKFENSIFRFLGDCQFIMKVDLVKPDHLI